MPCDVWLQPLTRSHLLKGYLCRTPSCYRLRSGHMHHRTHNECSRVDKPVC